MACALDVQKLDLSKLGLYGSSHLKYYKTNQHHPTALFRLELNKFARCNSYSGFQMMDVVHEWTSLKTRKKSGGKIKQWHDFKNDLAASGDTSAFFVFLSNDWKYFLSDNGVILEPTNNAISRWEKLPRNKRSQFDAFSSSCPLRKECRIHLEDCFKAYKKKLQHILSTSELEFILHCSVLERLNPNHPHLDLLYAILNSYLSHNLSCWSKTGDIKNKFGKSISFNFINAQRLFHKYDDPRNIFDPDEVEEKEEITHRQVFAYREVIDLLKKCVGYSS